MAWNWNSQLRSVFNALIAAPDGNILHMFLYCGSLRQQIPPSQSLPQPWKKDESLWQQTPPSQSLLLPRKKDGSLKLHHLNLSCCLERRVASSMLFHKRLHSTRTHLKTFLNIHHTSGLPASWGGGQSFARDVFEPFCGGWCCWSLGHLGHWGHGGGLLLQLGAGLLVGALVSRLWGPLALADARGVHAACPHLQLK